MNATDQPLPYDAQCRVELVRCESLLEMIQRRELMINCRRGGVFIVDPGGLERRGHDLKQLLESMR